MDDYMHLCRKASDVFVRCHMEAVSSGDNRWELCSRVLARTDVVDKLSEARY